MEVQENSTYLGEYSAHTEGFRFHPTDRELIKYLLLYMINSPLSALVPITTEDLYSIEPWIVFNDRKERTLYFFTELKKKRTGNTRYVRSVGKGSWKSQDKGKAVCSERGSIIGYKRSLRYQNSGSPHDGQWLMKEYSICDDVKRHLRRRFRNYNKDNYVLCRVKRKGGKDHSITQTEETIEVGELDDIIGPPKPEFTPELTLGLNGVYPKQQQQQHTQYISTMERVECTQSMPLPITDSAVVPKDPRLKTKIYPVEYF